MLASSLDGLARAVPRRPLALYSGGIDGSYLLKWLVDHGAEPIALTVDLGTGIDPSVSHRAAALGVEVVRLDAAEEFHRDFLPSAIHAEVFYQGLYPIGSSISRPLFGRLAATLARARGCDAICHSATALQNSGVRLSMAIAHCAPGVPLAAPFLRSPVPRETMLDALATAGITFSRGVHSIDTNPWARVIECGSLDSPENDLDDEVFAWTAPPSEASAVPAAVIDLRFEAGLPVAIDGRRLPMRAIVRELNDLAGRRGVGRYSGLEDTFLQGKNHEVREAPAATVITTAHRALANAVFDGREHAVRNTLAVAWTESVVAGGWFDHTTQCLGDALARLDRIVTGVVRLRVQMGCVVVARLDSPHGLYRHGADGRRWPDDTAAGQQALITALTHVDRLRRTEAHAMNTEEEG